MSKFNINLTFVFMMFDLSQSTMKILSTRISVIMLLKCPKGLTFPTQIRSFRHLWILPQHHLGWKMSKKRLSALVIFVLLFWGCEIITFIAKRGHGYIMVKHLNVHACQYTRICKFSHPIPKCLNPFFTFKFDPFSRCKQMVRKVCRSQNVNKSGNKSSVCR